MTPQQIALLLRAADVLLEQYQTLVLAGLDNDCRDAFVSLADAEGRLRAAAKIGLRGNALDHINGNCCDNRPENLRLVTLSQNRRNRY